MNGATMSKIVDKLVKLNILLGKANFVSEVLQLLIVLHTCRYSLMANSKESGSVDARYTDCTMMLNTRGELDASDSCLSSTETCGMVLVITSIFHDSQLLFVLCPFANVTAVMFHEGGGTVGGLWSIIWTPCWPG